MNTDSQAYATQSKLLEKRKGLAQRTTEFIGAKMEGIEDQIDAATGENGDAAAGAAIIAAQIWMYYAALNPNINPQWLKNAQDGASQYTSLEKDISMGKFVGEKETSLPEKPVDEAKLNSINLRSGLHEGIATMRLRCDLSMQYSLNKAKELAKYRKCAAIWTDPTEIPLDGNSDETATRGGCLEGQTKDEKNKYLMLASGPEGKVKRGEIAKCLLAKCKAMPPNPSSFDGSVSLQGMVQTPEALKAGPVGIHLAASAIAEFNIKEWLTKRVQKQADQHETHFFSKMKSLLVPEGMFEADVTMAGYDSLEDVAKGQTGGSVEELVSGKATEIVEEAKEATGSSEAIEQMQLAQEAAEEAKGQAEEERAEIEEEQEIEGEGEEEGDGEKEDDQKNGKSTKSNKKSKDKTKKNAKGAEKMLRGMGFEGCEGGVSDAVASQAADLIMWMDTAHEASNGQTLLTPAQSEEELMKMNPSHNVVSLGIRDNVRSTEYHSCIGGPDCENSPDAATHSGAGSCALLLFSQKPS